MIIKCIAETPSPAQAVQLGERYRPSRQVFPVRLGSEYLVFGLEQYGSVMWALIETEMGFLASAPLLLFAIVDGTVPPFWQLRMHESGEVSITPPELSDPYFLDDLAEGFPRTVEIFQQLKSRTLACFAP